MPTPPKYSDAEGMKMLRDHYDKGMTYEEMSIKWGMPMSSIQRYIEKPRLQEKYLAELERRRVKAEIRGRVAQIKAGEAAPKMMDQIIEIASQDVEKTPIQYQYAIQNAAADVLNRAGVKDKTDDSKEVRVIIDSGIELGTPDGND